jgi:PAS domain-containing protein
MTAAMNHNRERCLDKSEGSALLRLSIDATLVRTWTDVVEKMSVAVFLIANSCGAWQVLFLNSPAIRMFGYKHSDIVNQSIEMLIPQSAHGTFGCHQDGTAFPIDVFITPETHGAALARILIVRDIAKRTQSEASLLRVQNPPVSQAKSPNDTIARSNPRRALQTIWSLHEALAQIFTSTDYALHIALFEETVRNLGRSSRCTGTAPGSCVDSVQPF